MAPLLEVAVFSPASALLAQSTGAGRVELNAPDSYASGGTTPPLKPFCALSAQMTIPIRIMIRPRGPPPDGSTDFLYTETEFETMKRDVQSFRDSGNLDLSRGDGFVFGILTKEDDVLRVDVDRNSQLTQLARPFPCVFHRAFDPIAASSAWSAGLEDLGAAGFRGLLTSGGVGNMRDNLPRLHEIIATARQEIEVVAGGGLRAEIFGPEIARLGGADDRRLWLHTAALAKGPDGQVIEDVDPGELQALLEKLKE